MKAADVMHEAARVHERVLVRTVHRDPVGVVGDAVTARGADQHRWFRDA
jgi:hypothetical protein